MPRTGRLPFAFAIFVSAFLLFQVQLLMGREVLPLFGGAAAVWTVCVFVFQLLFLAGYAYSHAITKWFALRRQVIVHGALLGASAIYLGVMAYLRSAPIAVGTDWRPPPGANPTWTIVEFLMRAIGLPFFLLSATSPLLQHWFAQDGPRRMPYRLYALSNVGSLLGLLSYAFFVEPHVGLRAQRWDWAAGYVLFLVCYYLTARTLISRSAAACARWSPRTTLPWPRKDLVSPGPWPGPWRAKKRWSPLLSRSARTVGWPLRLFWVSLAACASVLLLATTNLICQDIAVSPFLWILQLSLYLISFIVCFENDRWYRREIIYPLFAITVALVIVVSLPGAAYSFLTQLAAYSSALFFGCMVCHGETARTRPRPESLTAFYLCIAAGGTVGGLVVSLLAPAIFPNYWEYPLGVLGCVAVLLSVSAAERSSWWYTRPSFFGTGDSRRRGPACARRGFLRLETGGAVAAIAGRLRGGAPRRSPQSSGTLSSAARRTPRPRRFSCATPRESSWHCSRPAC